jgi:prepilin peptidase CpaA
VTPERTLEQIFILLLFPALMAYAAASDLVSMTISNKVSLILVAGFLVAALALGMPLPEVGKHLGTGGLVLILTFAMFAAGWIGGGDAKLAAATALWLGWDKAMEYAVVASLFGGALTLLILQFRSWPLPRFALGMEWLAHLHHPRTGIPYGIALAAAGLSLYSGSPLWNLAFAR